MIVELTDEFIEILLQKAKRKTLIEIQGDEFNPCDMYGGNMDDSYFGGQDDGETVMARQILENVGIDWS